MSISTAAAGHPAESSTGRSSLYLPHEIIELILSNCPAKSVIRFKSVSKSWQSIISDPRFPTLHRIQRSKLPAEQSKFFIWPHRHRRLHLAKLEGETFQSESSSLRYPSGNFSPLSSCDGLFLLHSPDNGYMLWNPLIGKQFIVPAFYTAKCKYRYPRARYSNLYRDSVTGGYNIVFVDTRRYAVYSCRDGRWSKVQDFEIPSEWGIDRVKFTACVDGCFYGWWHGEVICFDARDEGLHMLAQPEGRYWLVRVRLEAVSGRLCLYGSRGNGEGGLQLWVMEEIGGSKYWRKLISMERSKIYCIHNVTPVCVTDEDDVVLWVKLKDNEPTHLIYHPRTNRVLPLMHFTPGDYYDQYFSYSENLYMPS